MPRCHASSPASARPLRRAELDDLLRSLFFDTSDPKLSLIAFTATAQGLYTFCSADDVDAALLAIPRERGSGRPIAHTIH